MADEPDVSPSATDLGGADADGPVAPPKKVDRRVRMHGPRRFDKTVARRIELDSLLEELRFGAFFLESPEKSLAMESPQTALLISYAMLLELWGEPALDFERIGPLGSSRRKAVLAALKGRLKELFAREERLPDAAYRFVYAQRPELDRVATMLPASYPIPHGPFRFIRVKEILRASYTDYFKRKFGIVLNSRFYDSNWIVGKRENEIVKNPALVIDWDSSQETAKQYMERRFGDLNLNDRPFADDVFRASKRFYNAIAQAMHRQGKTISDAFPVRADGRSGALTKRGGQVITRANAYDELMRQRELTAARRHRYYLRKKEKRPQAD